MRRLLLGILTFGAMSAAHAGDSALAPWFDKIPAPPKTLGEAQSRVTASDRQTLSCSGYREFRETLGAYRAKLEDQHQKAERDVSVQKGEPQTAEEMNARMQKAQSGMAKAQPAQDEFMAVTQKYQQEVTALMQKGLPPEKLGPELQKLQEKWAPKMEAAQKKYEAAMNTEEIQGPKVDLDKGELPQVLAVRTQLDEMQELYPQSVTQLADSHKNDHDRLNERLRDKGAACYEPHVAAAGADIQTEAAEWSKARAAARAQAADVDKLLASVKYGAGAKTAYSRERLIAKQMDWLSHVETYVSAAETVCTNAVAWSKSRDFVAGGGDVCDQPSYFKFCGPESIGRDYTSIARTCQAKRRR